MVTYDHSLTTTKQNKGGNSSADPCISVLVHYASFKTADKLQASVIQTWTSLLQ